MKKNILAFAILLYTCIAGAQTVTVIDKITQQSIPGVIVYTKTPQQSGLTNAKGQIYLKPADSVYFKHVVYEEAVYSFQQLEASKFQTELTENKISLNEVVVSSNRWEEDKMEWLVDGQVYSTVTKADVGANNYPFNEQFHLIINLAVGGNWPGNPDASTKFSQHYIVDYVRVFQKN